MFAFFGALLVCGQHRILCQGGKRAVDAWLIVDGFSV